MDRPLSLTARTYLLACDPGTRRVAARMRMGQLLRTAALTDLLHAGLIADDDGKVVVTGTGRCEDAVLDDVLRGIDGSSRRPWKHWVRKDAERIERALRDQLAADRVIAVEPRRALGVFTVHRVTVRDHRAHKTLVESAARALTGSTPVRQLDRDEAVLAALAALGELNTVTTGKVRRANRQRIKALVESTGPAVPALKKALAESAAAAAA